MSAYVVREFVKLRESLAARPTLLCVRMSSLRVSATARTPLRRSSAISAAKVVWIATTAGIVSRNGQGKARRPLHLQIGDIQVANKRTRTQSVEYASVQ
jgi:hypothetical protein